MGSKSYRWLVALCALGSGAAWAQHHTIRFLDPSAVPTGHLPDTGGILHPNSHNFQEDGVHVEAIWAPFTHEGFVQGHFHHLENGFETSHGFGDVDAEGWHDIQGFYLRMVDGRPFTLVSLDYRLRVDLQNTDILATTDFEPTQAFTGQFSHFPVTRFSTFKTLYFAGFEDLNEVFISSVLAFNNTDQIQFDNIVLWTAPPVFGACCPDSGLTCSQQEEADCVASGGTYVGDDVACIGGTYCPTRAGACCSSDGADCEIKAEGDCAPPDGAFAGLGTECGTEGSCPLQTGKCCLENGAECVNTFAPLCVGSNTFFHGAGTQCLVDEFCFVPCDTDEDCADENACNGTETCQTQTGECVAGTELNCDDSSACSSDSCNPVTGCEHTVIDCDDIDPCTADGCDPASGCTHTNVDCADGDVCNGLESCDPQSGLCNTGTPLSCGDKDECTLDGCDAVLGCTHIPVICDDGSDCTIDQCDPVSGCGYVARVCDDADVCTADACDPEIGCTTSPIECDDVDPCTTDACDSVAGCTHVAVVCDDGDVCNGLENCNAKTGECQPGSAATCDDQDVCTIDECDPTSGCTFAPVSCDDANPCTLDQCDSVVGCKHIAVECGDTDVCNGIETCNTTTGLCDPGLPPDCDDLNACTSDGCDPANGCKHVESDCDDGDSCTVDACDPLLGCANTPVVCDDADACNGLETCDAGTGSCLSGKALFCDDGDACTVDGCDPIAGCTFVPGSFDDGDLCTIDSCDAELGCVHSPVACDDGDFCNGPERCAAETGTCEPGVAPTCDDGNVCTTDGCDPLLGCTFASVSCGDNDYCTVDSCDGVLGCVHSAVECDDGDSCNGVEACNALTGECDTGTPLVCDDANACTTDACDPVGGCSHFAIVCDDGDPCTTDGCDPQVGCVSTEVDCDDGDLCNGSETCDDLTGACILGEPLVCDDQDACTVDACDPPTGCATTPLSCDDGEHCTTDACDGVSGCTHEAVQCDDGDVCNGTESCDSKDGECTPSTPLSCEDEDACTAHACDPQLGCLVTPVNCDDLDPCTVDSCDTLSGCRHESLCAAGLACVEGDCVCFELQGDWDGDGNRGLLDFGHLLPCLAGPDVGAAPACTCQDLNDDGRIDLLDLAEFMATAGEP